MDQTDRQTDKATHWKTAVYDEGDDKTGAHWSGQWAKLDTIPSFVKTLYRQKEVCPETQRLHFQVHVVCHRQCRRTQLSGWIKHTKWIPVVGEQHITNSINYCSKKDTAVPGTYEVTQGEEYMRLHQLLQELAKHSEFELPQFSLDVVPKQSMNGWKWISRRLIMKDPIWADKLSNPTLRRMWEDWGSIFIWNWEEGGAHIIEAPPEEAGSVGSEEYLISED